MDGTPPHDLAPGDGTGVGSVAEEAARLLHALGAMTQNGSTGSDPRPRDETGGPGDRSDPDRAETGTSGDRAETGTSGDRPEPGTSGDRPAPERPHRCTCGAQQPPECQVCPLCRGIRLLRDVRPEVLVGLADLLAEVATSLRVLAQDRADGGQPARPEPGSREAPQGAAPAKGR